jgi:hypothetical protein
MPTGGQLWTAAVVYLAYLNQFSASAIFVTIFLSPVSFKNIISLSKIQAFRKLILLDSYYKKLCFSSLERNPSDLIIKFAGHCHNLNPKFCTN